RGFRIVRFDFFRINVFSISKDNDVLASACDGEVPIRIDETKIAGTVPAIVQRFGGMSVVAVITLHQQWTANPYFSNPIGVGRIDAHRHTANRLADGADSVGTQRRNR